MFRPLAVLLMLAAVLPSCGNFDAETEKPTPHPFGPTGVPPMLRKKGIEGTPVASGGNVPGNLGPAIALDEDLVFTDPDNPEAGIPELSAVLSAPKRGPWEEEESVARQRAAREGKALLIWFTDSGPGSPMCKALTQELFSRSDFGDWAEDKLVRLKVDISVTTESDSLREQQDRKIRLKNKSIELKKRYKVLGHPTLLMLKPNGEVVGRFRGYSRGEADFIWGQLKHSEGVISTAHQAWKVELGKKGYRDWEDTRGRKVFAKLASYQKGELILIEPDGTRAKTSESKLSDMDRGWITQQKSLRGIQ